MFTTLVCNFLLASCFHTDITSLCPKSTASNKHGIGTELSIFMIALSTVLATIAICLLITVIYQRRKIQKILSSRVPLEGSEEKRDNLDLKPDIINGKYNFPLIVKWEFQNLKIKILRYFLICIFK